MLTSQGLSTKRKKKWGKIQKQVLIFLVIRICAVKGVRSSNSLQNEAWEVVAKIMQQNAIDCRSRWLKAVSAVQKNQLWSEVEDETLRQVVANMGESVKWCKVSEQFNGMSFSKGYQTFRRSKECKQRWKTLMSHSLVRGQWSREQDYQLIYKIKLQGKNWKLISKNFKTPREQNALKHRFNSLVEWKKQTAKDKSQQQIVELLLRQLQATRQQDEVVHDQVEEKEMEPVQFVPRQNKFQSSFPSGDDEFNIFKKVGNINKLQAKNYEYPVRQPTMAQPYKDYLVVSSPPAVSKSWAFALVNSNKKLIYFIKKSGRLVHPCPRIEGKPIASPHISVLYSPVPGLDHYVVLSPMNKQNSNVNIEIRSFNSNSPADFMLNFKNYMHH